ncbi:hypothetical protein scyTo_0020499 [Scyliorhinus torazame]|uniref:Uncharacterized protein n=1 Tax=Scyliorhinus torazame TaxID=75743 RepID=A0A401PUC5_SCYTO|nr:hypothetical protein [Scyliorhinus torazame]
MDPKILIQTIDLDAGKIKEISDKQNLKRAERQAIRQLKSHLDIVIKPDRGNSTSFQRHTRIRLKTWTVLHEIPPEYGVTENLRRLEMVGVACRDLYIKRINPRVKSGRFVKLLPDYESKDRDVYTRCMYNAG